MDRKDFPAFATAFLIMVAAFAWAWHMRNLPLKLPVFIDFAREPHEAQLHGFSYAEEWGRWSDSPTAAIEFSRALPVDFRLRMKMKAFGPNVNRSIVVRCGAISHSINGAADFEMVEMAFHLSSREHSISIDVPKPTSPEELGLSKDSRLLGIAIQQAEVLPLQ